MLLRHVIRKQGRNYFWRAVIYTWISWWTIWRIWRKCRERNAKSPQKLLKTPGKKGQKQCSPNVVFDDSDKCVIRNTKRVGIMRRICQLKRKFWYRQQTLLHGGQGTCRKDRSIGIMDTYVLHTTNWQTAT